MVSTFSCSHTLWLTDLQVVYNQCQLPSLDNYYDYLWSKRHWDHQIWIECKMDVCNFSGDCVIKWCSKFITLFIECQPPTSHCFHLNGTSDPSNIQLLHLILEFKLIQKNYHIIQMCYLMFSIRSWNRNSVPNINRCFNKVFQWI